MSEWLDTPTHKHSTVEPTLHLRWSAEGKLQQAFFITDYAHGGRVGMRQEWRDVPTEQASPPREGGR